jgi:hypothetical protein
MTEEIPEYLGRDCKRERKIMVRFRCGNEERENRLLDGRREREVQNVQ